MTDANISPVIIVVLPVLLIRKLMPDLSKNKNTAIVTSAQFSLYMKFVQEPARP